LIERAALVISNDSGPMHIAAALGNPSSPSFGPTNPIRTGPYKRENTVVRVDIPAALLFAQMFSPKCLKWLTIDPVLRAVASAISPAQLGR